MTRVVVTGAAGQIGYSLVLLAASGGLLGADRPIELRLLDIEPAMPRLLAVVMELEDMASATVSSVVATADPIEAFRDVDVALLVGARPRGPGMLRKDLLKANVAIFRSAGRALNEVASRDVKVLVVGNPANTNALICMKAAPSIPRANFSALTRLDQNRACAAIAKKVGVPVHRLRNVVIFGNHSSTQFPYAGQACVEAPDGSVETVVGMSDDTAWFTDSLVPFVQHRGKAVIEARGASSAASAASAICDHVRDWLLGSGGRVVSMAVPSDGNPWGIADDLIYSFPVIVSPGGAWSFADGFDLDEDSVRALRKSEAELLEEKEEALDTFAS